MTFYDAKEGRVCVNERHISAYINGWEVAAQRALSPVTTILDTGTRWTPGLASGKVSLTGPSDGTAGTLHTEAIAADGVDNSLLWSVWPSGLLLGYPAIMCASDLNSYKITSKVGQAVAMSIDAEPDDGVDIGVQLHALGAETADVNSTSVDNAASTANGGVVMLHVTAYSGLTNAVIKVQHSTDNSVWADLATLTTVTAVTSQRSLVAAGTTVNRYVRSFLDVTGTGSVTFALGFARR